MIVRAWSDSTDDQGRSNGKCMDELVSTCSTNEYFSFVDNIQEQSRKLLQNIIKPESTDATVRVNADERPEQALLPDMV